MNMSVVSRNTPTSPSEAKGVPETGPNPELLSSLGRLVRGLSALFWGLPLSLVVCVQTAKGEGFDKLNVFPPLGATLLLFYGFGFFGHFQKQVRVWRGGPPRPQECAPVQQGL